MKKAILLSTIYFLLMTTIPVFAAQPGGAGSSGGPGGSGQSSPQVNSINFEFPNPFKTGNNLYDLLKNIVEKVIIPIGGVLCVLAFIYAGFRYVWARGKPTAIQEANRALLYAAIGTAVLLGAWVISKVIENTIGALTT